MPLDFDYAAAKQAGYSDDDILTGLQQHGKLDFDLDAARKAGYSATDILSTLTATPEPSPAQKTDSGDFIRGAKEAFQQLPQLGYGLVAGAGAALESAVGEGGIATGIKKAGVKGYQEWGDKIAKNAKESDSFSYSYDKAKEGDFGAMVDWIQHGLGYAGGQGVQMLATAGVGSIVGKAGLKAAAEKIASGMVAKETARIAATEEGKQLAAGQIAKMATASVAEKLGQTAAIGATAYGMEGGEIFGDLASKSVTENRALSGEELAKAFGATLAAGSLEFVGDKVGLDVMLGKSALTKPAASMAGLGGRAARGAIAAAGAAPIEGATEYGQTLLEEFGKGNDPLSEESLKQAKDAAALGAIGGVAMGGAGGAIQSAQQQSEARAPEQPPLQLENNPDPLVSFPDGTVGRRADVDRYIASLPEDQQISARARLFGMGEKQATVEDINQAATVDDAIATASAIVDAPVVAPGSMEDFNAFLQREQRDIEFLRAQQQVEQKKQAQLLESGRDVQVEQADALTQAQGFDNPEPTAMQLAMQKAQERLKLVTTPVSKRATQGVPSNVQQIDAANLSNRDERPGGAETGAAMLGDPSVTSTPDAQLPAAQPSSSSQPAPVVGKDVPAAGVAADGQPALKVEPTNSLGRDSSWVIKNKATGEVIMETFDKKKVDALNKEKYEAVPIAKHLAGLNEKPALTGIQAEVARIKAAQATRLAGQQVPEKVEQSAPVATPVPGSRAEKFQNATSELEKATSKQLREIAATHKRAYMREAAAGILQMRDSENRAKRSDTAKKLIAQNKRIDVDRDSMAQAIGKLGGISRDSVSGRLRLAPEELGRRGHGLMRVFTKNGKTMDEIGAALAELGYVQRDENGKHDQTDFEDKLAEVAGGLDVFTPQGMMIRAQEEYEAAQREVGAESTDEYERIQDFADAIEPYIDDPEAWLREYEADRAKDPDIDFSAADQVEFEAEHAPFSGPQLMTDEEIDHVTEQIENTESGRGVEESAARDAREGAEGARASQESRAAEDFQLTSQDRADLEQKDTRANNQTVADRETADKQRDAFTLSAPPGTVEGEARAMSNKRQEGLLGRSADPAQFFQQGAFPQPEPFKNKTAANLYRDKNRIDGTTVETDSGWLFDPAPRALSASEIADANADIKELNRVLRAQGMSAVLPLQKIPTANHALAKQLGKIFGAKVQFVTNNPGFEGVAYKGVAYLTENLKRPELAIAGHEVFHTLEQKNPELAERLAKHVRAYLREDAVADRKVLEKLLAGKPVSDDHVTSEVLADINGAMWLDPKFWREMRERDENLFRQVAYRFMEVMTKAIESLVGTRFDVNALVTDVDAVRSLIAKTWAEHLTENSSEADDSLKMSRNTNFLQELARHDELFRLPKSDKTTIEGIVADNDPRITVKKLGQVPGEVARYQFTLPDGTTARMVVRQPGSIYGFDTVEGEMHVTDERLPGENPESAEDKEEVFIDVSLLDPAKGFGAAIYNIAANYAHNTDRIFIGDPAGLSDEAMFRRPQQMLSSALKFGTTEHLAPHPRQVSGDKSLGIPGLKWTHGDDEGNIRNLISVILQSIDNNGGNGDISYDISTGKFVDSHGNELSRDDISRMAGVGLGRSSQAGGATLARHALLKSLVQGKGGQVRGSDGILAALMEQLRQSRPADGNDPLHDIFYSRQNDAELNPSSPKPAESSDRDNSNVNQDNEDVRFSRVEILGNNDRVRTPEQLRAFKNVGRTIEVPTLKERMAGLWQDAGKKLAQGLADQFAPIKELSGEAYALMRLSKGAGGAFETMLRGGRLKLENGVYNFDETKRGGVIDRLLVPLQGEMDDFLWWVSANRADRLSKEDREHLFSPEDIAAIKTLDSGTTKFDYELQHGQNAGQKTRDRTLIYRDALKTFNEFHKNTLDMAEQSGLIDRQARSLWENEFYVPFYRVDEESGVRGANVKSGVIRQQAFKTLKGGTGKLNSDLLDNTLMNWAHLLDAAAKNRAAKASLDAAANVGIAIEAPEEAARQMGKSIGKRHNVVWYMEDGRQRYFLVDDPYVMTAIQGLEYAGMKGPLMDALGTMKHALTLGVTASPFFKVRNLIRDSVQAISTAPLDYNVAGNLAEGWKLTNPKSDAYFKLLAGGGTIHFGTMLEGSESKRVRALVESGVDSSTVLDSESKYKAFYKRVIEPAIDAYNELGNRGEAVNRAALYNQLIKQGKSHSEASLMARDLMDFSMSGAWTGIRFLTQVVPFMNARIQGLYKLGKSAKEDPARFATVLGAVAMSSIGLMLAYSDDDDWKKREDWDRDNYWWFKIGGQAFRIPKPFEIGAIGTLAERGIEYFTSDEMTGERFRKRLYALLSDNLSMNPTPQLVKPILDIYANKDSFSGRPIESLGMEKLAPEYRFTSRTSMAARGISTAGNAVTGAIGVEFASPVQIDHMIKGYFGWLGSFIVGTGDLIARPVTGQPEAATPDYWKTATGGMVSDVSSQSSRYVSQMYDQAKVLEEAYGTHRMLIKEGKLDEARAFAEDNADKLRKYRSVEAVKRAESMLNERIRIIERSAKTADEKRALIQQIQKQKDQIARRL